MDKMQIILEAREAGNPKLGDFYTNFRVSGSEGEVCVVVGGDGTFMRAARKHDIPILPIRDGMKGSIGYYADLSVEDIPFVIDNLKSRKYKVETLEHKLEVTYNNKSYYAVNEALVMCNPGSEISLLVKRVSDSREELIYPFVMSGDGLVVTGKVGSTAYNKSAGGPIIMTPEVMCVTFLNPDAPFKNPIILDKHSEVVLQVEKSEGYLGYDGVRIAGVGEGDRIGVKISDKELRVVKFEGRSEEFADKLERVIRGRMVR